MREPERPLDHISDGLVEYLRHKLRNPAIDYLDPLTPLQGGYETSTYRFQLSGLECDLAQPLVLRLYPGFYGTDGAVWESSIQNLLSDAGYPVARVHETCTDMSILGGAFFIMAFLKGELMMNIPFETIPDVLGSSHAALHEIDPQPLLSSLHERGVDPNRYRLDGRMKALQERVSEYPWLREAVDWLTANRPPESHCPSLCHGDFHPLNILVKDGRVSGVLDWAGFMVADAIVDVANTVILTTISAKHLLSLAEWEIAFELYLDAYHSQRSLDLEYLDYYRARRCVIALADGASGKSVWQFPPIVRDLVECTREVTGITVRPGPAPA